jgi:cytochrome c556
MRRSKWFLATFVVLTAGALALGVYQTAEAQKKGKERLALTKYLMRGINGPNCGGLKKTLDAGPSDDEAWETAALQASLLNEMGYLLMADGRCPDGEWAGACTILRDSSAEVLAAVEKKDLDAAKSAFATLTTACGKCHKAHKD